MSDVAYKIVDAVNQQTTFCPFGRDFLISRTDFGLSRLKDQATKHISIIIIIIIIIIP